MKLKLWITNPQHLKIIIKTICFISILVNAILLFFLFSYPNKKSSTTNFNATIYVEAIDKNPPNYNNAKPSTFIEPKELFHHNIYQNLTTNYITINCHLGDSISSVLENTIIAKHFFIQTSIYGKFVENIADWDLNIYKKPDHKYWQLLDFNNEVQCPSTNNFRCTYGIMDLKVMQPETYIQWEMTSYAN